MIIFPFDATEEQLCRQLVTAIAKEAVTVLVALILVVAFLQIDFSSDGGVFEMRFNLILKFRL
ncbi:hypothetical protein SOVF_078080 [Spinacia oleracea]|nr:hypothetical protein SOVF_078080 [Spinacia oleracea]